MKTRVLLLVAVMSCVAMSGVGQNIVLPQPQLGDATLKSALENRCSSRNYDATSEIEMQELSNLLWAGWGYNREDKRTAPSALNRQEITLYVCNSQGVYRYDAAKNSLILVSNKDIREATGKQEFVKDAAVNIVYVCNTELLDSPAMNAFCCGAISQNIALYCATVGIGNVVRGSFDGELLHKMLNLSDKETVIITQSVGYTAK